jgi:PD-(D/E)XK nuclease superfamily/LAGLIDADG-like domain
VADLTVSNSELSAWTRCRRKWLLQYYWRFGPDPARLLPFGNKELGQRVHLALEGAYGHGLDALAVLNWVYSRALEQRPDCENDLIKERDYAVTMVEGFLDWAAETGFDAGYEVVAAERIARATIPLRKGQQMELLTKLDVLRRRLDDGAVLFIDWKPQPLTEPVLTPDGWTAMGKLSPGDLVCGAHGEPVLVKDVFDRGEDDIFRVVFSDGTSVRATADHPWLAVRYGSAQPRIMRTDELKKGTALVPYAPDSKNGGSDVLIEPYLLGAWIANGDLRGRKITDGEKATLAVTGLPIGLDKEEQDTVFAVLLEKEHRTALAELGILGLKSENRFIPECYMFGTSYQQRLDLLRGLMDADGTRAHSVYYSTVSSQLAQDVADLVRSLGGWAKIWVNKHPTYTGTIERRIIMRTTFNPFHASAHAKGWQEHQDYLKNLPRGARGKHGGKRIQKVVSSVEPAGREEVRCIDLDSEEHLYVTSGYAVTHNTTASLKKKLNELHGSHQMRTYALVQALNSKENPFHTRADGGEYVAILRSKRTERAKGPFYDRAATAYNKHDLNSAWQRARAIGSEIWEARQALDAGADHHDVAYNSRGDDCDWACVFRDICPLFDDGSRAEEMLTVEFTPADPYAHYYDDIMEQAIAALKEKE